MQSQENSGRLTTALLILITVIVLVLMPRAWAGDKYGTLHRFTSGGGRLLWGGVILDKAGNLYGTTVEGGGLSPNRGTGSGIVFKLTRNSNGSWTESVLYRFCSLGDCRDGQFPIGDLIFDGDGNLYGATSLGGKGYGVVFELTPSDGSWIETVLHSFTGRGDGASPASALIFDSSGNLYGTTSEGVGTFGTVYELIRHTGGPWTKKNLHTFTGGANGNSPAHGVIFDADGNLYGTTALGGGLVNAGTVFRLNPSNGGWMFSVLHRFGLRSGDGAYPSFSSLTRDTAGNLFGTTNRGGLLDYGTVFKLTKSTRTGKWQETVIHSFVDLHQGALPYSGVVFDLGGDLYGTTYFGGSSLGRCKSSGCGVVFKLAQTSNGKWKQTVLHLFLDQPGAFPYGTPIFDGAGNLYGTTAGDIDVDFNTTFGSVYEIKP